MPKTFLMCKPEYYGIEYEINPWMTMNIGKVNKDLAMEQWNNLYKIISNYSTVKLIDQIKGLPDMVFTANAGSVCGENVIVSQFKNKERKKESAHFAGWFKHHGYSMPDFPFYLSYEGDGDSLLDWNGIRWCGYGQRSSECASFYLEKAFLDKCESLKLVNKKFYHLDTAFCPLHYGYLLYYPDAFCKISQQKIIDYFGEDKLISVSKEDAENFACNAVNLDKDKIILNRASEELINRLENIGFSVIQTDMSEFMKSGGSCKCLTLEI